MRGARRRRDVTRAFSRFACIDWSGAKGAGQKGIALAVSDSAGQAPRLVPPPDRLWSRPAVLDWLLAHAEAGSDMLIGIDFSPSLPFADAGGFFPGWRESPPDAASLWAMVDRLCGDDPHLGATAFLSHPEAGRHFRHAADRIGDRFVAGTGRLRVVERACREGGHGPAQSGFNLIGAAQVGKSGLTGMRLLHRLAGRVPVWPFDPVPARGPLIVEIYTTVAARAASRARGRSKIRDAAGLDAALAALGDGPHTPLPRYDDHMTDALITAAWLRRAAVLPTHWSPEALTPALARTEGWTFGIT